MDLTGAAGLDAQTIGAALAVGSANGERHTAPVPRRRAHSFAEPAPGVAYRFELVSGTITTGVAAQTLTAELRLQSLFHGAHLQDARVRMYRPPICAFTRAHCSATIECVTVTSCSPS